MRKILFTLFTSVVLSSSTAQEIISVSADHPPAYTFNDESYIRDEPYGEITGTLPPGLQMVVEGIVDMSEIRGEKDVWYEVTFNYNNRNRYGLIASIHLADKFLEGEKGEYFLYKELDDKIVELKVVKNGKELNSLQYQSPDRFADSPMAWEKRKRRKKEKVISIPYHISCESTSGKIFLSWDGTELQLQGNER